MCTCEWEISCEDFRLLLPGKVVESKRKPLIFRLLVVTSRPDPGKVAESYEMDDDDDDANPFDEGSDEARTRIMRG